MGEVIYIASDHAGFELKRDLISIFPEFQWKDLGPMNSDSIDYPDMADRVALEVQKGAGRGILICGSGQGMAIRANKYPNIRAALCWNVESARLARSHNDANLLCLGARFLSPDESQEVVKTFLKTEFEGGRHQKRVDKLIKPIRSQ